MLKAVRQENDVCLVTTRRGVKIKKIWQFFSVALLPRQLVRSLIHAKHLTQ